MEGIADHWLMNTNVRWIPGLGTDGEWELLRAWKRSVRWRGAFGLHSHLDCRHVLMSCFIH